MVHMNLSELTIYKHRKTFIDLLCYSPHVEMEGSVSSADVQEVHDMFRKGAIYLMTVDEANEYLALKHEKEVETKEEENNEEHN